EGADGSRRERAGGIGESRATLERPAREAAVQEARGEGVAGAGAVDRLDRVPRDVALEAFARDVAAVRAERHGGCARSELAQAPGRSRRVALPRDRARLGETWRYEVAMRQGGQHALPAAAGVE